MGTKIFYHTAGVVFMLAGLFHAVRVTLEWDLVLGGYSIPVWMSVVAVVVSWILAYTAFKGPKQVIGDQN